MISLSEELSIVAIDVSLAGDSALVIALPPVLLLALGWWFVQGRKRHDMPQRA